MRGEFAEIALNIRSHDSHGGWSPNCNSSGRSPLPRSTSQTEWLEGTDQAALMGMQDIAN